VNSLQAAAAEAFVEILRDAGVPVTTGGKDYQAMVSPSGLAVDLEEGGFTQDGALTVRLLAAHLPISPPTHNDTILIGGDRYKIVSVVWWARRAAWTFPARSISLAKSAGWWMPTWNSLRRRTSLSGKARLALRRAPERKRSISAKASICSWVAKETFVTVASHCLKYGVSE